MASVPTRIDVARPNGAPVSFTIEVDPNLSPRLYGFLNDKTLYEPDVGHAMLRILRPGDVAIDVGSVWRTEWHDPQR